MPNGSIHRVRRRSMRALAAIGVFAALLASCGTAAPDDPAPATDVDSDAESSGDEPDPEEVSRDDDSPDTSSIEELELDMASFMNPGSAQGVAIQWWIDELEARTSGNVRVNAFWNSELLGPAEMRDGLSDGRVDLGNITYAYFPSDFPLTRIVEVPFIGDNTPAQTLALNDLYQNSADFRAEWESQGIKVMSFVGIPPALTGATEPVSSIDWYEGKTLRAVAFFLEAVEAVGGNPAAIPVTEIYEAMERGTIDAYGGMILDAITPIGLHEVGPHIHDPRLGHFASSTWTMTTEVWESLSPELRTIIEELNTEFPDALAAAYEETEDAACDAILEAGGSVTIFSEEETQRWAEAIGDEPLNDWVAIAEAAGADGAAMYEEYLAYFQDGVSEYSDYRSGTERCAARS